MWAALWVKRLVGKRAFHGSSAPLRPEVDPGYFGLFEQKAPPQPQPQPQPQPPHDHDNDPDREMRQQLHIAFREKIKEWARTTPKDYVSRPLSYPRWEKSHKSDIDRSAEEQKEDEEKEEEEEDDNDDYDEDNEDDDGNPDYDYTDMDDEHATDDELDAIDDEDELRRHDAGDEHKAGSSDDEKPQTRRADFEDDMFGGDDKGKAAKGEERPLRFDPPYDPGDEMLYYFTDKGKLKYRRPIIIAPKDEIYDELIKGGLISAKRKRPLPVLKLVKKTDAEIVGWYYYCSIELLQFFKICHNLSEVKAIVEYHIRWSAIHTLAKKYRCNPREIVKKYGRDLECEDKKGRKVRLLTRLEIKTMARGVNKRVEMCHRFGALRALAEMD